MDDFNATDWLPLANKVAGSFAASYDHIEREDMFAELSLWLVEKGEAASRGSSMEVALRNAAIDYVRSVRARPVDQLHEHEAEEVDETSNPEALVLRNEKVQAVRDAVYGHSPEAAMIFRLVFQERRSHGECALRMRLPMSTYDRLWQKIRTDLAGELGEWA